MDSCAEKDAQREWQKRQNPQSVPPKKQTNRKRFNCHLLRNWFSVHKQQQACFTIILLQEITVIETERDAQPTLPIYTDIVFLESSTVQTYLVEYILFGFQLFIWPCVWTLAKPKTAKQRFVSLPSCPPPRRPTAIFFLNLHGPQGKCLAILPTKRRKKVIVFQKPLHRVYMEGISTMEEAAKNQQNSYLFHGWLILATHKCTFWNFHSICFIHHRCMEEEDKPYIHMMMMIWWWVSSWKMNNVNWHFFFNDW